MVVGMKDIKEVIKDLIQLLIAGVMAYGVTTLKDLSNNVATLNTQVAVLIQQNTTSEKRIEKLEEKVFNK